MSVRHEELRMIERSALEDDPVIGKHLQKGDERVDLVGGHRGRDAKRLDDRAVELVDGKHIAAPAIELDHLPKREHVAIVKVRRSERHVAERRDFERALNPKTLVHDRAIEYLADRGTVRKEPARQRERPKCIGCTDAEVVVGRPHADVVETLVDNIAVAIAHRPIRGEADAADRSVRQLM